jgi:hypothetical protein
MVSPSVLRLSLHGSDIVPTDAPLALSVAVVDHSLAGGPPTLRVALTNDSDHSWTYLTTGRPVFGGVESTGGGHRLLLLPAGFDVDHVGYRPSTDELVFDTKLVRNSLDPGDRLTETYDVWDHPDNDGHTYESGTYRFRDAYESDGTDPDFTWGFTVRTSRRTR